MENFIYDIPTRVYFGRGQIEQLKRELPAYGTRILLVYGGGSIKKNGIYEELRQIERETGIEIFELSGVEANPTIRTAQRGIALCREYEVDAVLAVGGGSVIDCAKAVAAGPVLRRRSLGPGASLGQNYGGAPASDGSDDCGYGK